MDKPTSTAGAMSITYGVRSMKLKWPDGTPIKAGDLKAGHEYKFNAFTGVMVMGHDKVGPKEAQNRNLRNQRIEQNKRLIDSTVKTRARIIGKLGNVKVAKRVVPSKRGR